MSERNKTKAKLLTQSDSYYLDAKGYVDLRSSDKASTATWRIIAFVLAFITALAVSGLIFIGSQTKFIPMVFYTDSKGAMQYGGVASDHLKITQPMLANQLADYIISLRQIPQDMDLKNQYMRKIKMMSTNELFSNNIIPMIKERYTKNIGVTVKVTIRNVLPIGQNTWQLDWEEAIDTRLIGKFKGTVTFTINPSIFDPAILLYDPLGIVISDVNINQEVGG